MHPTAQPVRIACLLGASGLLPHALAQCPPNWVQQTPASSPGQRYAFALWFDAPRARTLLYGGVSSGAGFADTWSWDGSAWTELHPVHNPGPRSYAAFAYDPLRDRAVFFGGMSSQLSYRDTWEFDGTDWAMVSETGPSDRLAAAMAYHAGLQRVVLFGGRANSQGTIYADTWAWDGSTWTQIIGPGPTARAFHGMCPFGSDVICAGGQPVVVGSGNTWRFDGAAWTQAATEPVHFVSGPSLAYDAGRGRAIMSYFSGATGAYPNSWEFDGASWTFVANAGPGAGSTTAMTYDSIRGRIIFYGTTSLSIPAETWEWHGAPGPFQPRITMHPLPGAANPGQPVSFTAAASGTSPLSYRWRRNGVDLFDGPAAGGGTISGAATATLAISAVFAPDSGQYDAVISNTCGPATTTAAYLTCPIPECPCYANCDASTTPPCLNVLDFACFLGAFASAQTRANCDGSSFSPVLNVLDFLCFLNAFAAGCS